MIFRNRSQISEEKKWRKCIMIIVLKKGADERKVEELKKNLLDRGLTCPKGWIPH